MTKHGIKTEFGWKKLSPNKAEFYQSLIQLFSEENLLSFRCIVVDRRQLDHERARRILWIAEVLTASSGTIQPYTQTKKDSRGRDKKRRTYVVVDESYVVVLDDPRKPDKPFTFVTAIPANPSYIQAKIKQKAFLVETKVGGMRIEGGRYAPVLSATEAQPQTKTLGKGSASSEERANFMVVA